jgi:CHRD domain-containing protein
MKRLAVLIIVGLATLVGYSSSQAAPPTPKKHVVCHTTGSAKKPYRKIVVGTRAALKAHLAHPGDIVDPAGGVCPTQSLTALHGGRPMSTTLAPVAPNTVGGGSFVARSNIGQGRICWSLTVTGLSDVTAAHIHYLNGPLATQIAVPLALPTPFTGSATGCATVLRALVKQILVHPENFYVNVHTTTYPGGAISGTLAKGA